MYARKQPIEAVISEVVKKTHKHRKYRILWNHLELIIIIKIFAFKQKLTKGSNNTLFEQYISDSFPIETKRA